MGIPVIPKKPGTFMERLGAASAPAPKPEPRTEIVSSKRNRTLAPWMVVTASEAFKSYATISTVAGLLNVTVERLRGWLQESESEDCHDELLLTFGNACRQARATIDQKLMRNLEIHALEDPKTCMWLAERLNPDLNIAKKVQADVRVAPATKRNYDKLSEAELEQLTNLEMKLLED